MHRDSFEARLESALVTRPVIEQAKGVLVLLRRQPPSDSWEELRGAAETSDVLLQDLAGALVNVASNGIATPGPAYDAVMRTWGLLLGATRAS